MFAKLIVLFLCLFSIKLSESCMAKTNPNSSDSFNELEAAINQTENEAFSLKKFGFSIASVLVNGIVNLAIEIDGGDNFTCPEQNGTFGHHVNCNAYFNCTDGNATMGFCNTDFAFDQDKKTCVPKWNVKLCDYLEYDQNFKCAGEGLQPNPADCAKFYICVSGKGYLSRCGEEQMFDHKLNLCLPKNEVNCLERRKELPVM